MRKLTKTQKILIYLSEKGLLLKETLYNPSGFLYHELQIRDRIERQSFYNIVGRLKREGYLEEIEENGRQKIKATLKGKFKILKFLRKSKKWDGKWRIVIFDIPETQRRMRNFFREKLQDIGYRQLQESVWICPYNISDKTEDLIELCNARKYIHYLLVEELDNKDVLMNLFKLKEEKSN